MTNPNFETGAIFSFDIRVNGKPLDQEWQLARLDCHARLGESSRLICEFALTDLAGELKPDGGYYAFPIDQPITAALGYDGRTEPVFSGATTGLRFIRDQQGPRFIVEATGMASEPPQELPDPKSWGMENVLSFDLRSPGPSGIINTLGNTVFAPGDRIEAGEMIKPWDDFLPVLAVHQSVTSGEWTTGLEIG